MVDTNVRRLTVVNMISTTTSAIADGPAGPSVLRSVVKMYRIYVEGGFIDYLRGDVYRCS